MDIGDFLNRLFGRQHVRYTDPEYRTSASTKITGIPGPDKRNEFIRTRIMQSFATRRLDPADLTRSDLEYAEVPDIPSIEELNAYLTTHDIKAYAVGKRRTGGVIEYDMKPGKGMTIADLQAQQSRIAPFFGREEVSIEWHSGSPVVSLSFAPEGGKLYLGDFISSVRPTVPEYIFGMDSYSATVTYSPLKTGNLLICSSSSEQLSNVIESIFIHMNCTETDKSAEIYLIDPKSRYAKFNYSPLLKKTEINRDDIKGFLSLVEKELEFRADIYIRNKDSKILKKNIFVFIPDLSELFGGARNELSTLLDRLLLKSTKLGIFFIIGTKLTLTEGYCARIMPSMGGIINFRPFNEVIRKALPDAFIYSGAGITEKRYGIALHVSDSDLDLLPTLHNDPETVMDRYTNRIPDAVKVLDIIMITKQTGIESLMDALDWSYIRVANAIRFLEDLQIVSPPYTTGSREILITDEDWPDAVA